MFQIFFMLICQALFFVFMMGKDDFADFDVVTNYAFQLVEDFDTVGEVCQ